MIQINRLLVRQIQKFHKDNFTNAIKEPHRTDIEAIPSIVGRENDVHSFMQQACGDYHEIG